MKITTEDVGSLADFNPDSMPSGSIEIDGQVSTPDHKGIMDQLGFGEEQEGGYREHDATEKVLHGDDSEQLKQQLEELKSERGRYGREVVGPLRQENNELRERLAALEARMESPQSQPTQSAAPKLQDYAIALYGEDADLEDPEVMRDARLAQKLLSAAEAGTAHQMTALQQEILELRRQQAANLELSRLGIAPEKVRELEQEYPELSHLPEDARYSLLRKLMDAGKTPAARDTSGRFVSSAAAPGLPNPATVVEGGSGVFGSAESSQDTRFSRFKKLDGEAQKKVLIDLMKRGELS